MSKGLERKLEHYSQFNQTRETMKTVQDFLNKHPDAGLVILYPEQKLQHDGNFYCVSVGGLYSPPELAAVLHDLKIINVLEGV